MRDESENSKSQIPGRERNGGVSVRRVGCHSILLVTREIRSQPGNKWTPRGEDMI